MPPQFPVPPFAASLRLTEFEQISLAFAGWQGEVEQISSGRFEGALQIVAGEVVRAVAAEGTQRLRVRGRDASGLMAIYPLSARMALCTWDRRWLTPGQIFVGGAEEEIDIGSERQFTGQALYLPPRALEAAARVLLSAKRWNASRLSGSRAPAPEAFAAVDRQLQRLFSRCQAAPTLIASPEGRRLEQECLAALVSALFPSVPDATLSAPARAELIDRAEDFLRAQLGAPLGMIDLCQELGCNGRTLRLAFQHRFGVGPMTYFRFLRLNAVRTRLRADPDIAIAAAAREFGFHHLGNFAADYRRLFGGTPSQTPRG